MSITENNLLVVDEDASFIDEAKRLFDGRLPTVRSITEAVATTDSSGSYVLCRIPEEERVTVRVRSEAGASSHVLLDFSEAGVWIDEKLYRSLPGRIWKQDFQIIP